MAVGANSVRPPLFAYMVVQIHPRNSSKRDVEGAVPYRYSDKFLRRKIAPLFADIRFALG